MPLLEAMGMERYRLRSTTPRWQIISTSRCFVILRNLSLLLCKSNSSLNPNLIWYNADVTSISLALEKAYHSPPEARDNKRRAAIQTVQAHYSVETSASTPGRPLRAVRPAAAAPTYDAQNELPIRRSAASRPGGIRYFPLDVPRIHRHPNVVAKLLAHLRSACGGDCMHLAAAWRPRGHRQRGSGVREWLALGGLKGGRSVFSLVAERPDQTFLGLFGA